MVNMRSPPLLVVLWAHYLHAQVSPEWQLFEGFTERYNKPYQNDSGVKNIRFLAFKESLQRQEWLNRYEAERGGSATYGVNKFSDLTPQEFRERYLSGLKPSVNTPATRCLHRTPSLTEYISLNKTFDWRKHGAVGKIRNQKQCGSCWAFATVETIASRFAIQYKSLLELSAQQLISCDVKPGELNGCSGGTLYNAFDTVKQNDTIIVKDSVYPFESGDGKTHTCKTDLPKEGVKLLNFTFCYDVSNETIMQYWLVEHSPLTVSVNARAWQDYDGGIIQHHCDSSSTYVDHAVQIVGYDLTGPVPYWIVRNTWGTDWGEDGYVRLKFDHNMCGLRDEVVFVEDVAPVGL